MRRSRIVAAEVLDGLAQDNPEAMRSRRDLRRIHHVMGTASILLHALRDFGVARNGTAPIRVLELGAGDGTLMLGVARALGPAWQPAELTLLDRQSLVDPATIARYAALGWNASAAVADVFDWIECGRHFPTTEAETLRWDLIVANLFLHHFDDGRLAALLVRAAARTDRFLACEPRRAPLALAASYLVGAIGANAVTRTDAVLSVRAGFRGSELTRLWPASGGKWQVQEHSAGLFSHFFRAVRGEAK